MSAPEIHIRRYQSEDLAAVKSLNARIEPFRPEDHAEVEAMFARAREAERTRDRWVPLISSTDTLDCVDDSYLAFWVAVAEARAELSAPLPVEASKSDRPIVGMVGVRHCGDDTIQLASGLPLASEWQTHEDVAELRRLRVAPEHWGSGIGTRLCRAVIDWTRDREYRALILNMTAAQLPAIALYRKLGFQEVGRSFTGAYELVWLELRF
jgi:RimJ/RimL family protein N-acetyltransferase